MESYLNTIWTFFEMDKSCIPVAKLSGRTQVLQVADTQWPENFSPCTFHTVSLFPLLRFQSCQCVGAKFWHIETSHKKPPFRKNNAFQRQPASHTTKPCGCWSIKSSRVLVRSLISRTLGDLGRSRFHGNLKPCLIQRTAFMPRKVLFEDLLATSFSWHTATSSFSEREPSNAPILNYEHPRSVCTEPCLLGAWKFLRPFARFSIWRRVDPWDPKRYDWQEKLRLFWQLTGCGTKTTHVSRGPFLPRGMAANTLEVSGPSMWVWSFHFLEHKNEKETDFTSTKTDLLRGRLKLNLNIKSRYVSGQKPFNRFQYQTLQHQEGRWCIFIVFILKPSRWNANSSLFLAILCGPFGLVKWAF